MPSAIAFASRGGTTTPMPVIVTGWRTPGRSVGDHGRVVEHRLDLHQTERLGAVDAADDQHVDRAVEGRHLRRAAARRGTSTGRPRRRILGSSRSQYCRSPTTSTYWPANSTRTSGCRSISAGIASTRNSMPFSVANRAADPMTGPDRATWSARNAAPRPVPAVGMTTGGGITRILRGNDAAVRVVGVVLGVGDDAVRQACGGRSSSRTRPRRRSG